jgi:hypothetical protein
MSGQDYQDSITFPEGNNRGSCVFAQTAVMSKKSSRDTRQQSRMVRGNKNGFTINTIDHQKNGQERLDATVTYTSTGNYIWYHICIYICIYTCMSILICIYIYICLYIYVYICMYTHICIYTYVYTYMFIYICMYIHISICNFLLYLSICFLLPLYIFNTSTRSLVVYALKSKDCDLYYAYDYNCCHYHHHYYHCNYNYHRYHYSNFFLN